MLSQRIALLLHENEQYLDSPEEGDLKEVINTLKENYDLFSSSHSYLLKEIPKGSIIFNTRKIRDHYQKENGLNDLINRFSSEFNEIQKNPNSDKIREFSNFCKGPLLVSLDQAVKFFEEYSVALNKSMERFILLTVFLSLVALALVYFFILSPLRDVVLANQAILKESEEKALDEAHFKSMFLANMSHELRTPLNGVLGVADLLASTPLSQEQLNYLKIINQSGETLLGVVNNILDLTKLELGQVDLEQQSFSPEELFSSIEYTFQYLILSKGLKYQLETQNLPPYLLGDKLRINQIINNLVGNAIKFTHEGTITFSAEYHQESLILKVKDTGIGMTSLQKQNVFTPFRQADASTTRKFGGTGLGLSIVREIVVLMGGKVECHSQIGVGTTFEVNLPLSRTDQAPEKVAPLSETSFGQGKILVVDDNSINLNLMLKILERMNLEVKGALSGEDAIKLVQEEKFDLIFMDYHMPGLDGIETTKEIKKIESAKNIPIIALTADVQESTRKEVLNVGMVELLSKPVRRKELSNALKVHLKVENA